MSKPNTSTSQFENGIDRSHSAGEEKSELCPPTLSCPSDAWVAKIQRNMRRHHIVIHGFAEQSQEECVDEQHAEPSAAPELCGLPLSRTEVDPGGAPACTDVWSDDEQSVSLTTAQDQSWQIYQASNASTTLDQATLLDSFVPYSGEERATWAPLLAALSSVVPTDDLIEQIYRETGLPVDDLRTFHEHGILQPIPKNDQNELTSIGSLGHPAGDCSPCLFWFRKACTKGIACIFCHFMHKGQQNKRFRPSRKTRIQKRLANAYSYGGGTGGSEDDSITSEQDATTAPKRPELPARKGQ